MQFLIVACRRNLERNASEIATKSLSKPKLNHPRFEEQIGWNNHLQKCNNLVSFSWKYKDKKLKDLPDIK